MTCATRGPVKTEVSAGPTRVSSTSVVVPQASMALSVSTELMLAMAIPAIMEALVKCLRRGDTRKFLIYYCT